MAIPSTEIIEWDDSQYLRKGDTFEQWRKKTNGLADFVIPEIFNSNFGFTSSGHAKIGDLIIQWGSLTPSAIETTLDLPVAFTTGCYYATGSIGEIFTDSVYSDNSLICGAYPSGLTQIKVLQNLHIGSGRIWKKMFWLAIGK